MILEKENIEHISKKDIIKDIEDGTITVDLKLPDNWARKERFINNFLKYRLIWRLEHDIELFEDIKSGDKEEYSWAYNKGSDDLCTYVISNAYIVGYPQKLIDDYKCPLSGKSARLVMKDATTIVLAELTREIPYEGKDIREHLKGNFVWKEIEGVDKPFVPDDGFIRTNITVTSGKLAFAGDNLRDSLIDPIWDKEEDFKYRCDEHDIEKDAIEFFEYFAKANIMFYPAPAYANLYQKKDGTIVLGKKYIYSEDDHELSDGPEMEELLGKKLVELGCNLDMDHTVLVCDASLIPKDTKKDEFATIDVENGTYEVSYNWACDNKVETFVEVRKIS